MTTCVIRCSISFLILVVFILVTRVPEDSLGSAVLKEIYCSGNANHCNFDYEEVSMDFDDIPNKNSIHKRSLFGPFENASEEIQNKVRKQWTEFFKQWIPQIRRHTHEHLDKEVKQLCRENQDEISTIIDCDTLDQEKQMLHSVCISAVSKEITQCTKLKNEDLPIQVCREGDANRIEICGQHIASGLCASSPNEPKPPIVPCNIPKLSICFKNGTIAYCPEGGVDSITTDEQFKFFVKEWIPPIPDVTIFDTKVDWDDLCYNKSDSTVLTVCNKHEACIYVDGTIVNCTEAKEEITHIPICVQKPSRHLIVCAEDWSAYLCFPVDQTRSKMISPCNTGYRHICLNEEGKKEHCLHKPGEASGSATDISIIPPIPAVTTTVPTTEEDERFMRIYCADCSVENELIVIGDPESVEKEMETITFKPLE